MADPNADLGRSRVERSALLAVRAFSDAMDRMHTGLRSDMDMNATDLSALRMLSIREQRGELVKPHDLARHLGISSASTTKMLDRLSKEGFIERAPHPKDRRALVITLTESSRQDFGR
ncbi:MAG: MarR family transcriptional regulator, partial [Microbacterium sp.]|nr:MarR family transcriptional regulator [Microbacterium sp.]